MSGLPTPEPSNRAPCGQGYCIAVEDRVFVECSDYAFERGQNICHRLFPCRGEADSAVVLLAPSRTPRFQMEAGCQTGSRLCGEMMERAA